MSKDKYKDEKYLRLKIEEISVEIKAKQSKLQHLEYQLTKLLLKKEGKPVIDMTAKESEKAAASIVAAIRKDLSKIEEEILRAIARSPLGKGKAQEGTSTPPVEPATKPLIPKEEKSRSGWYPENFDHDLALEAFGLKKEKK